ncbi:MAG: hypothetical protein AB1465_04220 [Patescibacteria group bacterium]
MTAYRGEPFLRESWEEKTQREKTDQTLEEKAWKVFQTIEEIAENYPELAKFAEDIKSSILRYGKIIERRKQAIRSSNREEIETSDQEQRIAHNALIDSLNILSRQCRNKEVSNLWRQDIGIERDQITAWAMRVYKTLESLEEKVN